MADRGIPITLLIFKNKSIHGRLLNIGLLVEYWTGDGGQGAGHDVMARSMNISMQSPNIKGVNGLPMVSRLAAIADDVNELQRRILEVVFDPGARKTLRLFTLREASRWLGLSVPRLREICEKDDIVPEAQRRQGARGGMMLSAAQIMAAREALRRRNPKALRYRPGRARWRGLPDRGFDDL